MAVRAEEIVRSDDECVVRRVLAGDVEAFEIIVRRYNQRLYRFARGYVPDDQDAREIVQECYVRAYLNLASFRGPGGFSTWLHVIARNEALGLLRRQRREIPTEPESMNHRFDEVATLHAPDPAVALETERMGKALESALDRLPEAFRAVFVLRAIEGMSARETALILDVNEKTVKTRLFRARRLLRERFRRHLQDAGDAVYEFAGARCDALTAAVMARVRAAETIHRS